ncbi:hypothetical protein ACN26Y_06470 [Micromonospora sp. WMMD558]|uniref:hypothetical protein n=1 Tax=Micromonospora sp. WMMD558 TaxID=3403462 RepID=UPI003BF5CDA4
MTEWRRLSARRGVSSDDGPYEGTPSHLRASLDHWLKSAMTAITVTAGTRHRTLNGNIIRRVALAVRLPLRSNVPTSTLMADFLHSCHSADDRYLDALDAALYMAPHADASELARILEEGGSVWTLRGDRKGLERRVDPAATQAFEQATDPDDLASAELGQAWSRAFGRDADASDAWDHAIKAVEAILAPIVVPAQDKPQIGHVLGQLRSQSDRWRLAVPGPEQNHSIDPLVTMLQTIWPNPDRHAAGNPRTPSLAEAQAVLHLAVTIVQWGRSGAIARA